MTRSSDGRNWYTYCGNDPVNAVDPEGLLPKIPPALRDAIKVLGETLRVIIGGGQPTDSGPDGGPPSNSPKPSPKPQPKSPPYVGPPRDYGPPKLPPGVTIPPPRGGPSVGPPRSGGGILGVVGPIVGGMELLPDAVRPFVGRARDIKDQYRQMEEE